MTLFALQYEPVVSDAELHRFTAAALVARGEECPLASIERKPSEYSSSFAIEELTAVFADGSRLPLIFKDLSSRSLLNDARQARQRLGHNPAREVYVYRRLLSQARLGTAACYSAVADAANDRYWLLLEKVNGSDLARVGDFSIWIATARWLAGAHRRLHDAAGIGGDAHLTEYGSACFHCWIDEAERALRQGFVASDQAVERGGIQRLLDRARRAVEMVCALPVEVTHGEFYPSNILIEGHSEGARICAIDWETAGFGPALLDLAALVAGSWSESEKYRIASAYFAAKAEFDGQREPALHPMTALRCCRLLLAMKWIGLSATWQPPPEHRHDWLGEALKAAHMLNDDLEKL